jgi:hypothetical protein
MMISSSGNAVVPGMMSFSTLLTLFSGLARLDYLLPSLTGILANPCSKLSRSPFAPLGASRNQVLRRKIFSHAGHAELVSPTIHHRVVRSKIIAGRRRGDSPFERVGAPGVAVHTFFAAEKTPQKVKKEEAFAKTVRRIAMVMKLRSADPAATTEANGLLGKMREWAIRPSQCMGMKTQ